MAWDLCTKQIRKVREYQSPLLPLFILVFLFLMVFLFFFFLSLTNQQNVVWRPSDGSMDSHQMSEGSPRRAVHRCFISQRSSISICPPLPLPSPILLIPTPYSFSPFPPSPIALTLLLLFLDWQTKWLTAMSALECDDDVMASGGPSSQLLLKLGSRVRAAVHKRLVSHL